MTGGTPANSYLDDLEWSYVELITSRGYAGAKKCLLDEITCYLCGKGFREDEDFKEHLDKYHDFPFAEYLIYDPEYAEKHRTFWCYLCAEVTTTTVADGGRKAHIKECHETTVELFDHFTKIAEQEAQKRIVARNVCVVNVEKSA